MKLVTARDLGWDLSLRLQISSSQPSDPLGHLWTPRLRYCTGSLWSWNKMAHLSGFFTESCFSLSIVEYISGLRRSPLKKFAWCHWIPSRLMHLLSVTCWMSPASVSIRLSYKRQNMGLRRKKSGSGSPAWYSSPPPCSPQGLKTQALPSSRRVALECGPWPHDLRWWQEL